LLTVEDQLTDPKATVIVESTLGIKETLKPNDIADLLGKIRKAIVGDRKVTITLREFTVPNKSQSGEIFPLRVSWHVARNQEFVDTVAKDKFRPAFDSNTPIPPEVIAQTKADRDRNYDPSSLTAFATAFEMNLSQYKLAAKPSDEMSGDPHLFVVDAKLLTVTRRGDAGYFAPRPLSNNLWTGEVSFPVYSNPDDPNKTTLKTERVSDVDVDEYARFFFAAFEETVSAGSIAAIDAGSFGQLMTAKDIVSQRLKKLVKPLLKENDGKVPAEVVTAFYEHCRANLTNCYSVHCILRVPVTVFAFSDDERSPRLYGKIDHTQKGKDKDYTFTFASTKVPLKKQSAESDLTLLFAAKPVHSTKTAYLPRVVEFDLFYTVTHIEMDVKGGPPSPEGYNPTSFLALILPKSTKLVDALAIPIPLRKCPVPPVITSQAATLGPPDQVDIVKAKAWTYSLQYEQEDEVRDEVTISVRYPEPKERSLTIGTNDLAKGLVSFQRTYSQIRTRLSGAYAEAWLKEVAKIVKACMDGWDQLTVLADLPPKLPDTYYVESGQPDKDTSRTVSEGPILRGDIRRRGTEDRGSSPCRGATFWRQ
jgi:hypothetical protein